MISKFAESKSKKKLAILKIPRRPEWNKEQTSEEIERQENVAFLEWRRDLATVESSSVTLAITPFEKNVHVWRQLWRVIEKADLLL
jgi:large subunit GTPase 1